MKELIDQFGPAVLVTLVFVALGVFVVKMIGTDATSVVGQAFTGLLQQLTAIGK